MNKAIKNCIRIVFFLLFISVLRSQNSGFRLRDMSQPNSKFIAWTIIPEYNFSGRGFSFNTLFREGHHLKLNHSFNQQKFSQKHITNFRLNNQFQFDNTNPNNKIRFTINHADYDSKWYKKKKTFFGFQTNFILEFQDILHNGSLDLRRNYLRVNPYFGYGRVENVQDAWRAIQIFNELKKENCLSREYTIDDVQSLSNVINDMRFKRIFDFRNYYKRILTSYDTYLDESNILQKKDIDYYTSLMDFSLNANIFPRLKGWWLYGGPIVQHRNTTRLDSFQYYKYSYGAQTTFQYELPINLKWQYGASANFIYGVTDVGFSSVNFAGIEDAFSLLMIQKLAYYPNSRTFFELNGRLNYFEGNLGFFSTLRERNFELNFTNFYFISPFLTVNTALNYTNNSFGSFTPTVDDLLTFRFGVNYILR